MSDSPILTPRLICAPCADAIAFYKAAFGATEIDCYKTPEGFVVHASLSIRGGVLSLADAAPDWGLRSPSQLGGSPVLLTLICDDPDQVAEHSVSLGAEVVVPIADQFYGHREGRIRDPFGHLWILSRIDRAMSPEEIQKGVDNFPAPGTEA